MIVTDVNQRWLEASSAPWILPSICLIYCHTQRPQRTGYLFLQEKGRYGCHVLQKKTITSYGELNLCVYTSDEGGGMPATLATKGRIRSKISVGSLWWQDHIQLRNIGRWGSLSIFHVQTWVWPRWNRAEPCNGRYKSIAQDISRKLVKSLPSHLETTKYIKKAIKNSNDKLINYLFPFSNIRFRNTSLHTLLNASVIKYPSTLG